MRQRHADDGGSQEPRDGHPRLAQPPADQREPDKLDQAAWIFLGDNCCSSHFVLHSFRLINILAEGRQGSLKTV